MMQGVILAAGKGTRLHPLTARRSKAMAPVAGMPLVARVMATLSANGIQRFVLVAAPQDTELRDYFGDGGRHGLTIDYVEQGERLGMAHALGQATHVIDGPFVLSACDSLVDSSHIGALLAAHREHQAAATLSLMPVAREQIARTGIVEWTPPFVRRIIEKPDPAQAPSNIASLPLYVFAPDVLALLPDIRPSARGEYELQDAIQQLIDRTGRVTGVFAPARRQVTDAADLLAMNRSFLREQAGVRVADSAQVGANVRLAGPVLVEEDVCIGADAVIGPEVYIEQGAQIGAQAHIARAVVLRYARIEAGTEITDQIVSTGGAA